MLTQNEAQAYCIGVVRVLRVAAYCLLVPPEFRLLLDRMAVRGGSLLYGLGRELFFHRIKQRVDVERLFEGTTCTEEFRNIEEVVIALCSCDRDYFGIDIFSSELKRGLKAVRLRHQQVHDHEIDQLFLIEREPFASILGFKYAVPCLDQDLFQQPSDGLFVVND